MLWSILGPLLGPVLERVIPDVNARAAAKEAMQSAVEQGDLEVIKAQLGVQVQEAASASVFVAGARPFLLWVCGAGVAILMFMYLVMPWLAALFGLPLPPAVEPQVIDLLLYLTASLCGIRAFEGWKGVKRERL